MPATEAIINLMSLRTRVSALLYRRGSSSVDRAPGRAVLWLRLAAWVAPRLSDAHRDLVELLRKLEDRWGAVNVARAVADRFPESADAWLLLGQAHLGVYRQEDALRAFEQALRLEERSDAAMSAGELYRRLGRHPDAAARFARAYAAGGGPEALWENARSLNQAGDLEAADEALQLWASLVPKGMEQLEAARVRLRAAES